MKYRVDMIIRIEGKTWTEYLRMDVDTPKIPTSDHIEIEMDYEEAKAFLDSLSRAISIIDDSDNRRSKNQPRESQNGV